MAWRRYLPYFYHQIASSTLWRGQRKRLTAFELCDGLQSIGTAAYAEYRKVKNNQLFFSTRVYRKNMITGPDLERRLGILAEGRALRLVFSGRLIPIKGVDHL